MSQVKVQGNASGTGVFTLAAPNGNTDRTLTLPDSAGTIATSESTLTQFNASGSAPVYACRAWVNFNGTNTVAIRASGNVSSITDNGTGDYTVNFTTAMPDANYSFLGTSSDPNDDAVGPVAIGMKSSTYVPSTTARRFETIFNGINYDSAWTGIAIFR